MSKQATKAALIASLLCIDTASAVYVGNNPTRYVDPTGLVQWDGTATSGALIGAVGASGTYFELKSECINGKRWVAKVFGTGPALGLGATASGTRGGVTFNDDFSSPDPYRAFNGGFRMAAAGFAFGPKNESTWDVGKRGGGYGAAAIKCGNALSFGHGIMYGIDASISAVGGSCTVLDAYEENCNECSVR